MGVEGVTFEQPMMIRGVVYEGDGWVRVTLLGADGKTAQMMLQCPPPPPALLASVERELKVYRLIFGDICEALEKYPPNEVRLNVLKRILGDLHPYVTPPPIWGEDSVGDDDL